MVRRILTLAAMVAAASIAPLSPARAEFFTYEQMRNMCRGETEETAEFRTGAAQRLLAETYRARCRMYLLGLADAYLQSRAEGREAPRCTWADMTESEVSQPLVEAVLDRADAPDGGINALVRDVLHSRFGCD